MSTTNTTFTVENLVAKYINFVAEAESKKNEDGFPGIPGEPEKQLLITLYNAIAGEGADSRIQEALSQQANEYSQNALSQEELSFLCEHFREVSCACFSRLEEHDFEKYSDIEKGLIKKSINPEAGSTVFIAESGYCGVAELFPNCIIKGFTEYDEGSNDSEKWALGQIKMFSLGIKSLILPSQRGSLEESYIHDVDYVVWATFMFYSFEGPNKFYDALRNKAKMLFFMDVKDAAGNSGESFGLREAMENDNAIESIISYERHFFDLFHRRMILVLLDKTSKRIVHIEDNDKGDSFDIASENLDCECLWPSFYRTKRPSDGTSLSKLADFKEMEKPKKILKDGVWEFTDKFMNMPVVIHSKMAREYKDANLSSSASYYGDGSFSNEWIYAACIIPEPCVLLCGIGEQYFAGYVRELPETGMSTFIEIACLVPKTGIDVRYLTALLFSSEVKNQIIGICDGEITSSTLPLILNKIIVPNHTDKERLAFLSEANYEALQSSQQELKEERYNYIKAVRMRKHALTQSFASMEATFVTLNKYRIRHEGKLADDDIISRMKKYTVRDAFEQLSMDFINLMPALDHIADVEYSFDKPEWIDPENFIVNYINKKGKEWHSFEPVVKWGKNNNIAKADYKDPKTGEIILKKGVALNMMFFPKDALEKIMNNIVANAISHGFTDPERHDYKLCFSWHSDGIAIVLEIENNGAPIPADRDVDSLLEYGVSTSLHQDGHNGIGCNEIDDIMRRYDGNVKIISRPEEEFPVKYILTFNQTNIAQFK